MKSSNSKEPNNQKRLISNQVLINNFSSNFLPTAITLTILAPFNRLKLILQTIQLSSINQQEKVYKPSYLLPSKILFDF